MPAHSEHATARTRHTLRTWRTARRRARQAAPAPITAPALRGATEQMVETSAGAIRVRTVGTGPVVLFVHGLLVDSQVWNATAAPLSATHTCVLPDLPAGSHSVPMRPGADLTPAGIARLLQELTDVLDLRDVTVVANDSGGAITQLWMADGAPRVARVVLATCDAYQHFPPAGFSIYPLMARSRALTWLAMQSMHVRPLRSLPLTYGGLTHRRVDPSLTRAWLDPVMRDARIRADVRAFLRGFGKHVLEDALPRLRRFDRPVLLAWAPEQRWFPIEDAERLAVDLPNARIEEILGSGAFPQLDRPDELARLVTAFTAELAASAA